MAGRKVRVSIVLRLKDKQTRDDVVQFITEFGNNINEQTVVFEFEEDTQDERVVIAPPKICYRHSRICFSVIVRPAEKYVTYVGINGLDVYEGIITTFIEEFIKCIGGKAIWESSTQ